MIFSEEFYKKVLVDIANKIQFSSPEIYVLRYGISEDDYLKMKDKVMIGLMKKYNFKQIYDGIIRDTNIECFTIEKFKEFMMAIKCEFELYESNDGILYKRICDIIKNIK